MGVASLKKKQSREHAEPLALEFMTRVPTETILAGSLRRGAVEVGDIDLVAVGLFPKEIEGATFISGGDVMRTYLYKGTQVNVMIAKPDAVGAMLLYATGSGGFGSMLRVKAARRNQKLNRYGLFDRDTGELIAATSEEEIFAAMGKRFYPPGERS